MCCFQRWGPDSGVGLDPTQMTLFTTFGTTEMSEGSRGAWDLAQAGALLVCCVVSSPRPDPGHFQGWFPWGSWRRQGHLDTSPALPPSCSGPLLCPAGGSWRGGEDSSADPWLSGCLPFFPPLHEPAGWGSAWQGSILLAGSFSGC